MMKNECKMKSIPYGGATILIANLIYQNYWGFTFFIAITFVIGALTLPELITFMSDNKKITIINDFG